MTKDVKKVAWGITGSGDKITETLEVMRAIAKEFQDHVKIQVYVSKAGEQVIRSYHLMEELQKSFEVQIEQNSNTPFLGGALQLKKFEFLLIAPATSNTVAKISLGIADTMLSNAASLALKSMVPVYVMPVDFREGRTTTYLPDGKTLEIRVRKEDAENAHRLGTIDGLTVLEKPSDIRQIFTQRAR